MNHTIRNRILVPAAMAALALLSGCSTLNTANTSEFSCQDKNCPTPFEVYNETNNAPAAIKNGRTPASWGKNGGKAQEEVRLDLTRLHPSATLAVADDPRAQPLREPSQVMRIWIAPWIDQGDNLNWSGYVYTEVTPKRWAFGEQEIRHQGMAPQFLAPNVRQQ